MSSTVPPSESGIDTSIPRISPTDLLALIDAPGESKIDERNGSILVVDLRRADIEGDKAYMIPGAINLPAQTFQQSLPTLLPMLSRYHKVIFHCNSCKPASRGSRSASAYQAALDAAGIPQEVSMAVILDGGISAWLETYPDRVVRIEA